ncbi:MAG: hypothetical protein IKC26_03735 [Clostridia bacterium]|nr:hypothetical protein [Clostridia bacterium]
MKKASANKRIQWFHTTVQANGFPNSTLLCERFDISLSQAKRDIRFLREVLNAPLEYDALRRGYTYSEPFSLPVTVTTSNDESLNGLLPSLDEGDYLPDSDAGESANITLLQLQIPYTAILEIRDKLAVAELKSYIQYEKGSSGKLERNCYKCEFHSVDRFLGALLSVDADIRIVSPKWLRQKLVNSAERILRLNSDPADSTE